MSPEPRTLERIAREFPAAEQATVIGLLRGYAGQLVLHGTRSSVSSPLSMTPTRNNAGIGKIPRVVGTITTRAGLEAFPHEYRDACDIAEVRLDEIGIFPGWVEACHRIERAGTPVMLTLRSKTDGGKCARSRAERRAILTQAVACASIIDVEHNSDSSQDISPTVHAAGKTLLVSYHDFARTPAREVLEKVIAEAGRHAEIVKIATMVKADADLLTLDAILREKRGVPLCLIGMGAKGTHTRTSYPALGSCLTYGYLDSVSAPGQLSAAELVAHLRRTLPAYDTEFIRRHGAR